MLTCVLVLGDSPKFISTECYLNKLSVKKKGCFLLKTTFDIKQDKASTFRPRNLKVALAGDADWKFQC